MPTIITRFAPSPTGYLHLGNARTALLNFLAAKQSGGQFILRVEDTDAERSQEVFLQSLLDDLRWLGLQWDAGPDVGGPAGPYRQSERHEIYATYLARLAAAELTYPCYCTQVELNVARRMQLAAGHPPRYAGTCSQLSAAERATRAERGLKPTLRFRVPKGRDVTFTDVVHGEQHFASDDIGDFIVQRADGSSAFFFSNAIDDALMGVTLVLRGDDHLSNTPRQLLLLEAFGLPAPRYGHMSMLLGLDGAPLSKRHGAASVHEYRHRGYLPTALCNHLMRLGHNCTEPGWLDPAAFPQAFELTHLGRAPAKFDEQQLRHWQKEAVARLSPAALQVWLQAELPAQLTPAEQTAFCNSVRHNIEHPADLQPWVEVVFGDLTTISTDARLSIKDAGSDFFVAALTALEQAGPDLKSLAKTLAVTTQRKGPALFMPLRAALTGYTHGPELGPLLPLIGAEKIRSRLSAAHMSAQAPI